MSLTGCIPGYNLTAVPLPGGFTGSRFPCIPCPQGTYKEQIGNLQCINCPSGTTTTGTGHTSAEDCGK